MMKVRAAALRRFGENNIREGAPLATIEEVLVPIYMYHRYQVEAAAKAIGGQDYTFSLKGKGDRDPQIVSPAEQRRSEEDEPDGKLPLMAHPSATGEHRLTRIRTDLI